MFDPERPLQLVHSVPEIEQMGMIEATRRALEHTHTDTFFRMHYVASRVGVVMRTALHHLGEISPSRIYNPRPSREHLQLIDSKGPKTRLDVLQALSDEPSYGEDDFDGGPVS